MTAEDPDNGAAEQGFSFSDERRIDPETGEVRNPADPSAQAAAGSGGEPDPQAAAPADPGAEPAEPGVEVPDDISGIDDTAAPVEGGVEDEQSADARLAAERLADLQRINAEYAAFRMRAKREQDRAREAGVQSVVEALYPVLDELRLAQENGDLTGPFETHAKKFIASLEKVGVVQFGEPGEEFDPSIHEALMQQPSDEVETATVFLVMQPGYRLGERVIRAARVGVQAPAE
ncbi:nucleotide exchange factor GrpE [Brevibacterium sp. R8603A2]|uniref:nucleotide exchange factor GrpE n=1 Tax=Brevibacterium sp. R8603A2 TaxID=2929779 RepID=UPI001FFC04F9|nr:nucleotide exchange factor GrpE [Brevibacterium sp. R8603A2]MCK1803001.1 nucleotide exchange factor GrpE [Brevibacterium sp. R8603A2]